VFSAIRYVDDVPRTVTPNGAGVIVRQAFGELAFRSLLLTVGSKEEYLSPWDKELTSGDMVLSNNARALPGVRLSMPLYNPVPLTGGWVSVKGNFFVGRGFDALYMERYTRESGALYVHDVLWHYKAASLRVGAPGEDRGLSLTIGFQHGAQWGGVSNNPRIGAQPASLVDFARVVMGMGGGEGATASDSVNVLGNQYGSYDFKVSRKSEAWSLDAYHQHYFDDKSGTIFNNGWDGLWGVELYLHKVSWLRKVLVERLDTRNQTGPMHFLDFDHQKYPAVGGGADNYYNNGEYTTGVSYFNRGLGSPLLPSPEYNRDGSVGFKNTRVLAWHFGAAGDVSQDLAYRVLFTVSDSWGLPYRPLLDNKTGQSLLVELTYRPPRLEGWAFTLSAAADRGNILGEESTALAIHIVKTGILSTARMR
jgi:hypothetical protein